MKWTKTMMANLRKHGDLGGTVLCSFSFSFPLKSRLYTAVKVVVS
jgi:hypothetical protein